MPAPFRSILGKQLEEKSTISSGWSTIAKVVRELDEDKIRDCKEDIDTLLVFAGLFSAVLTAFLIESYKGLQVDNSETTVQLLRELVAQKTGTNSSTTNPLSSNSSTSFAFHAPPAMIRINVLWFASLVFSLVTASLGMLVKQWLREYLAGEHIGPRERLRIRQFRRPAVERWQVFEAVALLPILLQLALGLFLIGLCYFTSSVHPSIGYTCLPLVGLWTLIIIFSVISPIWSLQCPYKTPLLKGVLRRLRYCVHSTVLYIAYAGEYGWSYVVYSVRSSSLFTSEELKLPRRIDFRYRPIEEEIFVSTNAGDPGILAKIDAELLDDDLLCGAITEALCDLELDGEDIMRFLLGTLSRRLEYGRFEGLPLDLRALNRKTVGRSVRTAISTLQRGILTATPLYFEKWMEQGLLLVLSLTATEYWEEIRPEVCDILAKCFDAERSKTCCALAEATCFGEPRNTAEVLAREYIQKIRDILLHCHNGKTSFSLLREIMCRRIHGREHDFNTFSLSDLGSWPRKLTAENMRHFVDLVADIVENSMHAHPSEPWDLCMDEAVAFIVNTIPDIEIHDPNADYPLRLSYTNLNQRLLTLLGCPSSCSRVLSHLARLTNSQWNTRCLGTAFRVMYRQPNDTAAILHNLHQSVTALLGAYLDPLQLCYTVLRIVRLPEALEFSSAWRAILSTIATSIEHVPLSATRESIQVAETSMAIVHALECGMEELEHSLLGFPEEEDPCALAYLSLDDERQYRMWMATFNIENSVFPDSLIHSLSLYVTKEQRWYRMRRLREMRYMETCVEVVAVKERYDVDK